jgi:hypothetical protein
MQQRFGNKVELEVIEKCYYQCQVTSGTGIKWNWLVPITSVRLEEKKQKNATHIVPED